MVVVEIPRELHELEAVPRAKDPPANVEATNREGGSVPGVLQGLEISALCGLGTLMGGGDPATFTPCAVCTFGLVLDDLDSEGELHSLGVVEVDPKAADLPPEVRVCRIGRSLDPLNGPFRDFHDLGGAETRREGKLDLLPRVLRPDDGLALSPLLLESTEDDSFQDFRGSRPGFLRLQDGGADE